VATDRNVSLELGIKWLDSEHAELAQLLEEFSSCIKQGGSAARAHRIVDAAIRCANAHFEHEEVVAEQLNYPKIEDEKFNHRNMRLQFTTLVGDTGGEYCDPVTLEHLEAMRALLEEHILGPDKDLAEFLKAAGQT
jgi:hemerythrin-like metal-binding protein